MTPEEEERFKAIRHKFYRLAKHGPPLLQEVLGYTQPNVEDHRSLLFEVARQGKLPALESLIDKKEREILEQIGHVGDPCQFCNSPHDMVKPGPCPVRKKQVQL